MMIQKMIANKLQVAMDERNMTMTEFSKELGIGRSTLQGYLKETSNPRADTIELLSERMGVFSRGIAQRSNRQRLLCSAGCTDGSSNICAPDETTSGGGTGNIPAV